MAGGKERKASTMHVTDCDVSSVEAGKERTIVGERLRKRERTDSAGASELSSREDVRRQSHHYPTL